MKRKKLFYVPGIISLIGIPILLFIFSSKIQPKVVMRMFLPTNIDTAEEALTFSTYTVLQDIKNKKVTRVYLEKSNSSNELEDYRILARKKFLINKMETLQFTNDTTQVLQVELNSESTYGEFVELSNLAIIYDFKRYAYVDDSYYFFPNPPPVKSAMFDCLAEDIVVLRWRYPTLWKEFSYAVKQNYPMYMGLIVLVIIPWTLWMRKSLKWHTAHPRT